MYKNLLVSIPTERSPRPVIDGAISLAARYQAQLDAVARALLQQETIERSALSALLAATPAVAPAPLPITEHESPRPIAESSAASLVRRQQQQGST